MLELSWGGVVLVVLVVLAVLALGAHYAYRIGRASGMLESHEEGWEAGHAAAEKQTMHDLAAVLEGYPTSRGLRAAIRALGGNPGPLPRRKRTAEAPNEQ